MDRSGPSFRIIGIVIRLVLIISVKKLKTDATDLFLFIWLGLGLCFAWYDSIIIID
jgi:hypothetical protein